LAFESTSYPQYSEFIHLSRYSRWLEDFKRRETWGETVYRLISFWRNRFPDVVTTDIADELYTAVYNLEVMPSMRTMMTAGPALDRDNVAGYNCSYVAAEGDGPTLDILTEEMISHGFDEPIKLRIKEPKVFDEVMYILLCGTGVGFSIERQYVSNLPTVGKPVDRSIYRKNNKNYPGVDSYELSSFNKRTNTIRVADSKYGWASALRILIVELYNGNFDVKWNTDEIRPEGAPLKTFGGRASGPEPINDLFRYCVSLFKSANGRKLSSIEAHGLLCKIASVVVVGGVRRSALISLSNLSDERMRYAKSGKWWEDHPEYNLANNSVCYTEKPSAEIFIKEWGALIESKSGERGIFNRAAARNIAGRSGRRDTSYDFGTNPCSEIILRSKQFCNLTETVVREKDTLEDLKRKIRLSTILGTLQASLTDFKYLSPEWKKNTEEEALLGVSLTGIMDHKVLSGKEDVDELWGEDFYNVKRWLRELKEVAIETNIEWAEKLGIQPAAAVTCVD
jgi:ribonucleoside-diphosphate reductase alpha chain